MSLLESHTFKNATERSEAILDSFTEAAEMGQVAWVLEEGEEVEVVDDAVVADDTDVQIPPTATPHAASAGTVSTYIKGSGKGRATTSTSNTNKDGFDTTTTDQHY
jgi:hypothetical protein